MSDVKKSNPPTWEKLIALFNGAARYIEELPLLNVDDDLLDWGAATRDHVPHDGDRVAEG